MSVKWRVRHKKCCTTIKKVYSNNKNTLQFKSFLKFEIISSDACHLLGSLVIRFQF